MFCALSQNYQHFLKNNISFRNQIVWETHKMFCFSFLFTCTHILWIGNCLSKKCTAKNLLFFSLLQWFAGGGWSFQVMFSASKLLIHTKSLIISLDHVLGLYGNALLWHSNLWNYLDPTKQNYWKNDFVDLTTHSFYYVKCFVVSELGACKVLELEC